MPNWPKTPPAAWQGTGSAGRTFCLWRAGYINTLTPTSSWSTHSAPTPRPALSTTSGITAWTAMSGAAPRASPCWTITASACDTSLTYRTPAPAETPWTRTSGGWPMSSASRWRRCSKKLTASATRILPSSLRTCRAGWWRITGTTTAGMSSTSLTDRFWKGMMILASRWSSSRLGPPASPTCCCPGAALNRTAGLIGTISRRFIPLIPRQPWVCWAPRSATAAARCCGKSNGPSRPPFADET